MGKLGIEWLLSKLPKFWWQSDLKKQQKASATAYGWIMDGDLDVQSK